MSSGPKVTKQLPVGTTVSGTAPLLSIPVKSRGVVLLRASVDMYLGTDPTSTTTTAGFLLKANDVLPVQASWFSGIDGILTYDIFAVTPTGSGVLFVWELN